MSWHQVRLPSLGLGVLRRGCDTESGSLERQDRVSGDSTRPDTSRAFPDTQKNTGGNLLVVPDAKKKEGRAAPVHTTNLKFHVAQHLVKFQYFLQRGCKAPKLAAIWICVSGKICKFKICNLRLGSARVSPNCTRKNMT